jgi:uncharacterized peroxidase-related enzyme
MSYFLKVTEPGHGSAQLQKPYDMLHTMFQMVPKVFVAQSIRPDLLEPLVQYVHRLMIEAHALPRSIKELIAAYVSKLNSCSYCVDAHSAMVMAQGFTLDEVQSILKDIDGSSLIDDKTKKLLYFSETITRNSYKIHEGSLQELRDHGCTDEELFEAIAVASLFNFMDRMADALGVPVEGFQEMMKQMNDT